MYKLRTRLKKQIGFTLIELLVALVVLTLLASVVGPNIMKALSKAESGTAKIQIEDLAAALDMYRLEVGHYPSQDQGLQSLVEKPSGVVGWNGPYLKKGVPKDPWGREYHYVYPGDHGAFDLYSLGADNQPGGEKENADIESWK